MVPLVSVILPVYNQEKYLEEAIVSILHQSYPDFELIILDDGSTDKSADIIRRFAAIDERIKAFFGVNSGKSNATNELVEKAQGKWCVFLDADDVMMPERIQKQLAFHQENTSVAASSCYCNYINENGNMFGTQRYPGLSTVASFKQAISNQEFITCSYTGLMVSRKAFLDAGGLRKNFEPCEDFEFFNRFADKGFILLIIPEILMKYRIHPAAVTVKKPIVVLDTIYYVEHCTQLRRAGLPEISAAEFVSIQQRNPWWVRMNRKRFNYAMINFRSAGFAILSKNYGLFLWQITCSVFLSPNYVFKKLINQLKK